MVLAEVGSLALYIVSIPALPQFFGKFYPFLLAKFL